MRIQNVMGFLPPEHERPHDPLDGRDKDILKHHKTLKAHKVVEDTDDIDSDRVPYEDLQPSPNGCKGRFAVTYDEGSLDICSHEAYFPHVAVKIIIRNDIKSDGTKVTLVSLQLPEDK